MNVLTFAALAFLAVRLVLAVRSARSRDGRRITATVLRGIGWRHVWPVPLVLTAVVAVAAALLLVPGLDIGWWTLLGGTGNPVFGMSDSTAGTALEWIVPLVFITLLIPALPLFAYSEERMFRTGAEGWSTWRRAWKVVQFGLVHALIGIPLGAALALSVGGTYFMAVYLRRFRTAGSRADATYESARAHTVYNGIIVVLVLVAIALDAFLAAS